MGDVARIQQLKYRSMVWGRIIHFKLNQPSLSYGLNCIIIVLYKVGRFNHFSGTVQIQDLGNKGSPITNVVFHQQLWKRP